MRPWKIYLNCIQILAIAIHSSHIKQKICWHVSGATYLGKPLTEDLTFTSHFTIANEIVSVVSAFQHLSRMQKDFEILSLLVFSIEERMIIRHFALIFTLSILLFAKGFQENKN